MNLEHVELSKNKLKQRVWRFVVFCDTSNQDIEIVFSKYSLLERATTRHKFKLVENWSRLLQSSVERNVAVPKPEVPKKTLDFIHKQAANRLQFKV